MCIPSTVKVKSREAETFIVVLDSFNSCMLSSSYRRINLLLINTVYNYSRTCILIASKILLFANVSHCV